MYFQTLYTFKDNFRAYKALIAAKYSGFDLQVVSEPPAFVLGETNKTPEFLAKFPLGKVLRRGAFMWRRFLHENGKLRL